MTALSAPTPPDSGRAWFAHWFCHCSVLAADRDQCPERCPEHDRPEMEPPALVGLAPGHLPFGYYPDLTQEPSR